MDNSDLFKSKSDGWKGATSRVFQNAKSQNFKVAVSQNWLLYQTKSLQKELGFFLQNCGSAQFFSFLMGISGDFILAILAIFRHGRQGSPMVAKGFQGPRGTPGMGEMS